MNTDEELNTPDADDIILWYSKSPHDSSTEDQIFQKRPASEEVVAFEASLATFQEVTPQSPSECNGLQLQNQMSGKKATAKQTEAEERQPNTEHSRNMTRLQNESSEEHEGCPRMKSQTNGETDTDSQNEVVERQDNPEVYNEFSRSSVEAGNTVKYGKFPVGNFPIHDTSTTQGYNSAPDALADVIHREGIPELTEIISAETVGGSAYKEGVTIPPVILMNSEQVPEPIQGSLGRTDSASIQPGIPMTNIVFTQPEISVPSMNTLESTGGRSGYNASSFIQPEISPPCTYSPTSCGKATDNLSSDDQHEMTYGLGRYSGDLSHESKVGAKRKNSEKDAQNKICKGKKIKQSEAEKKEKNAEKSRLNRKKKKLEVINLKKKIETLQSQIQEKDYIIDNLTRNQTVPENVRNNPPSDKNELDEKEFAEMMHQAEVEAFDPEKFLEIINDRLRSKGLSEIRVNDKELTAGVVRVEGGERKMKRRVLKHYFEMKSDKERNKKFRDCLERNGLS